MPEKLRQSAVSELAEETVSQQQAEGSEELPQQQPSGSFGTSLMVCTAQSVSPNHVTALTLLQQTHELSCAIPCSLLKAAGLHHIFCLCKDLSLSLMCQSQPKVPIPVLVTQVQPKENST